MSIKNPHSFLAGVWDWGILRGCFGQTRIEPTDIDGLVERNGYFLVLEAKSPNAKVKTGQKITFESMLKTGKFTVMIIYGQQNQPEKVEVWTPHEKRTFDPAGTDMLKALVAQWFVYVEGLGKKK